MSVEFNAPIVVGSREGLDDAVIAERIEAPEQLVDLGEILRDRKVTEIALMNVYAEGSGAFPGVTDPALFQNGIGGSGKILVTEAVADGVIRAAEALKGSRARLAVHSGLLTPRQQFRKFRDIQEQALAGKEQPSILDEVLAGRRGDVGGSVAKLAPNRLKAQIARFARENREELISVFAILKPGELATDKDLRALAVDVLTYRENRKLTSGNLDISTATSVHNLGRSVNLGLYHPETGDVLNMGAGLDMDTPALGVAWFEQHKLNHYRALVAQDPALQRFLKALGVTDVNDRVFQEIVNNRRTLWNGVRSVLDADGKPFFDFYDGESGHFTGKAKGDMNREEACRQAEELG